MALKRSSMAEKVRTITVVWEDESVDVGIYPGRYTPALIQEVTARAEAAGAEAESDQVEAIAAMVEPLLAWWDVLDDEGERLPATAEVIATLPITFTMLVVQEAGAAIRPPANRG
jgi:hypothetical protein